MGQALRAYSANDDEARINLGEGGLKVLLSAIVQSGSTATKVRLRAISRRCAKIDAAVIPPVGSMVRFERAGICVAARVVWAGRNNYELEFHEAIDERELLIAIGQKPSAPPTEPLFPIEHYIGHIADDEDDEEGKRLPISKH